MKPRADLVVEKAEGELIVLDKEGGEVHQFNESAAIIWDGLAKGLTTDVIAQLLSDSFDVEQRKAEADVRIAVDRFMELGLLDR